MTVALSGGADSLALAVCLAFLGPKAGWDCRALVVDHGLQADSALVAARAAAQARELGLTADVVEVVVDTEGGLEAAARTARYNALLEAAAAEPGDQARSCSGTRWTIRPRPSSWGSGRGSGPRSIAGMPVTVGPFRRPFLGLRRAETERICAAAGLDFWSDPHNDDPRFRRARLRHEVMPLLEDVLGGGVVEALGRTADQVREDVEFLDELGADGIRGRTSGRRPVRVGTGAAVPGASPGCARGRCRRLRPHRRPPGRARPPRHRLARPGSRRAARPHQCRAGSGSPAFRRRPLR